MCPPWCCPSSPHAQFQPSPGVAPCIQGILGCTRLCLAALSLQSNKHRDGMCPHGTQRDVSSWGTQSCWLLRASSLPFRGAGCLSPELCPSVPGDALSSLKDHREKCLEHLQLPGCTWSMDEGVFAAFTSNFAPRAEHWAGDAPAPPAPTSSRFPEPLPGAAGAISPPLPALVAAAKFSKELLSILILIGPFLIMMFSQQFQPITVSQGD